MSDEAAIREANESFYRAVAAGDLTLLTKVWSERQDVACMHPGWEVLLGRERVIETWRMILDQRGVPGITCARVHVHVLGDAAFVTCVERIPEIETELVATNIFAREAGTWRMVHHHSGAVHTPLTDQAPNEELDPESLN